LRLCFHIGVKQGFPCDSQGETPHLVIKVEGRTVLPALPHALSIGHHGGAILCDTLTAEGWLCQTTLADVDVALTR
jgi:hypothetical protein